MVPSLSETWQERKAGRSQNVEPSEEYHSLTIFPQNTSHQALRSGIGCLSAQNSLLRTVSPYATRFGQAKTPYVRLSLVEVFGSRIPTPKDFSVYEQLTTWIVDKQKTSPAVVVERLEGVLRGQAVELVGAGGTDCRVSEETKIWRESGAESGSDSWYLVLG